MPKNIKYIKEQAAWFVDGTIIKESELSPKEILELQQLATGESQLIIDRPNIDKPKLSETL